LPDTGAVKLFFELPVGILKAPVTVEKRLGVWICVNGQVKGFENQRVVIEMSEDIRNNAFIA